MGAIFRVVAAAGNADDTSIQPNMSQMFGEVVADFAKTMEQNGYGKAYEIQADREGTLLLYDVGYEAGSIRAYLAASEGREAKTWDNHPPAAERIAALDDVAKEFGGGFDGGVGKAARDARWKAFLEGKPVAVPQTKEELQGQPAPQPAGDTPGPNEPAAAAPAAPALPEPPAGLPASPISR